MDKDRFSWCEVYLRDDFTIEHYMWYVNYRDQLRLLLSDPFERISDKDYSRLNKEEIAITKMLKRKTSI